MAEINDLAAVAAYSSLVDALRAVFVWRPTDFYEDQSDK